MPFAAAILSLLATITLSLLAALSSPQAASQASSQPLDPAFMQTSPTVNPTVNPTTIPRPPLKCLQKGIVSYCIPNTFKYQVCSPTVKQVECPIDSYCKETTDKQGNTIAYCKFIG